MTQTASPAETLATQQLRILPRQTYRMHLSRGAMLVAINGSVLVKTVDTPLNWLPATVPAVPFRLDEGQCHLCSQSVLVEMQASGGIAVNCIVMTPAGFSATSAAWLMRWLRAVTLLRRERGGSKLAWVRLNQPSVERVQLTCGRQGRMSG